MHVTRDVLLAGTGPYRIEAPKKSSVQAILFDDVNQDGEWQPSEDSLIFPALPNQGDYRIRNIRLTEDQLAEFPPERTMLGFEVRTKDGGWHFQSNRVL